MSNQGLGIGGHQSARMASDTWLTPRFILDALGTFDLDPCSAPDPAIWPTAAEHITLPRDGLLEPWRGRVWLNPPYGNGVWQWMSRLADHGNGIALIFARTEVAGFVEQIWNRADGIMFLHARLYFHRADGTRASANSGAPSCLVAYGDRNVEDLRNAGLKGSVVSGWRN